MYIVMSINPVCHKHSCHIDIRKHYLRELCLSGIVKLIALCTHHMVTDVLTKSLPSAILVCHRSVMMGLRDILHSVCVYCELFLEDRGRLSGFAQWSVFRVYFAWGRAIIY